MPTEILVFILEKKQQLFAIGTIKINTGRYFSNLIYYNYRGFTISHLSIAFIEIYSIIFSKFNIDALLKWLINIIFLNLMLSNKYGTLCLTKP